MKKERLIKALSIEPGKSPRVIYIDESLNQIRRNFRSLMTISYRGAVLIYDADGKALKKSPNRVINGGDEAKIIYGPFIIMSEEFENLKRSEIKWIYEEFKCPHNFAIAKNGEMVFTGKAEPEGELYSYSIWQTEKQDIRYNPQDEPCLDDYKIVYTGKANYKENPLSLYSRFERNCPPDFLGRDLMSGDIISTNIDGKEEFYMISSCLSKIKIRA